MNPYRIKHKPTGLYYQPINNGNNLSKHGKVYLTKTNPLSQDYSKDYIWIQFNKYSKIYKEYSKYFPNMKDNETCGISCHISKSEFEIEYLQNCK